MKLGDIDVSNWREVVFDQRFVWSRTSGYKDWVRHSTGKRKGRIVDHNALCGMIRYYFYQRKDDFKIRISGDTINIIRK